MQRQFLIQKFFLSFTGIFFALALASSAHASDGVVLVELYTSQGCSSCPPADNFAARLIKKRKDLLVLSLPVDYWDYLGWKDTLAQKRFTTRQRNYARAMGSRRVYTPQMVIGGELHGVGSRPREILRLIERHKKTRGAKAQVHLKRGNAGVDLHIAAANISRAATIWRVNFIQKQTVDIGAGENSGATVSYHHVVKDMIPLGRWSGKEMSRQLSLGAGYDGVAVFIQAGHGRVLGAAGLSLSH